MNKYTHILILFSTILLFGCKHEIIPAPISNTPIFGIEGTAGEDSFSLNAGVDDVEMTPSLIQTDGIKIYQGVLGNNNSSFQIQLYNGNIDFPNQPKFDPTTINEIFFTPIDQGALWSVNMSDFSIGSNITEIKFYVDGVAQVQLNELKIYKPGKYNVCANVTFENQSVSTLCREIIVGFKKNADFKLDYEVISGNRLYASVANLQNSIAEVKWYINDNYVSSEIEIDTILPNSKYSLRAEVTFANQIVQTRAALVDVSYDGNGIPDFSQLATQSAQTWDYKAKLIYRKNGKSYSSENGLNLDSKIKVDEIKYHGLNSDGIAVYLLKGEIDAILQDSNMVSLPVKAKLAFGILVK